MHYIEWQQLQQGTLFLHKFCGSNGCQILPLRGLASLLKTYEKIQALQLIKDNESNHSFINSILTQRSHPLQIMGNAIK